MASKIFDEFHGKFEPCGCSDQNRFCLFDELVKEDRDEFIRTIQRNQFRFWPDDLYSAMKRRLLLRPDLLVLKESAKKKQKKEKSKSNIYVEFVEKNIDQEIPMIFTTYLPFR